MIQGKTQQRDRILNPEILEVPTKTYRAYKEDGHYIEKTIHMFRSVHVATDRYEPLMKGSKSKPPLSMFKYYKVRKLLGRAVASDYPDREGIATFIAFCVTKFYWDVVFNHVIDEHDTVSCANDLFELSVLPMTIKKKEYITIKNKGILNSIAINLTPKGLKNSKGVFYRLLLSRQHIVRIQNEIDNGRYYG